MTFRTDYIADAKGRVYKIKDLNRKNVGFFIQEQYHFVQMVRTRLESLHERLFEIRQSEGSTKPKTNTNQKLIKELKLKKYIATLDLGTIKDDAIVRENLRLRTILKLVNDAVKEEADHSYLLGLLNQGSAESV
jgi:hypothetical protein